MIRALVIVLILLARLAGTEVPRAGWSGSLLFVKEVMLPHAPDDERRENDQAIIAWRGERDRLQLRLPAAGYQERIVLTADIDAYEQAIAEVHLRSGGQILLDEITYEVQDCPLHVPAIADSTAVMTVRWTTGSLRADRRAGNVVLKDRWGAEERLMRLAGTEATRDDHQSAEPILDHPTWLTRLDLRGGTARVYWTDRLPNVYALGLTRDVGTEQLDYSLARLPGCPLLVEWKERAKEAIYRIRLVKQVAAAE